jgi:hypothetical protein
MDDNPYTPEGVSRAFQMEWLKQEIRTLKAQLAQAMETAEHMKEIAQTERDIKLDSLDVMFG